MPKMSLLELLKAAYSAQKNYQDKNFISYKAARQIVTRDRIDEWSTNHSLCLEHGTECPERSRLIRQVLRNNVFVFVVLVFAELECLMKKLVASNSRDMMLFDTKAFDRICESAELSAEQKQGLVRYRSYVGVLFADGGAQDLPRDAALPFLKRESLDKYGSYGVLYRVTILGQHLKNYGDTSFIAEKRIRPMTNPSEGDWKRLFREVQTLQQRRNHPGIIPLLASYTLETVESGHYVKNLHLLFPLAEMDLADWMTKSQIPSNIAMLSEYERQARLYRFIYDLVFSISFLHREIDGMFTSHHDLKPRNILVVIDELKIADFGHSHLRSIGEGSATEGAPGLGTYEYQPPEYWNEDGSRAQVKHGRAFDVWAAGCIILELATLIVHGWQSHMVTEFRNERKKNLKKNRKSPDSVQEDSDVSFHNNLIVVKDWAGRLKESSGSQPLNKILNLADEMLAAKPENRPFMWEIQMDLYNILKPYDKNISEPEGNLCIGPPLEDGSETIYGRGKEWRHRRLKIREHTETPLHRAVKRNDRTRTIRLWELGWPLSLPGINGETPQALLKKSDDIELRCLERDVRMMIEAARTGETRTIRGLLSTGLSRLMVEPDGHSALYEAIVSFQADVIDCLLEGQVNEQLMLWNLNPLELPLHTAARVGFTRALGRMLKYYPDINIAVANYYTALNCAVEGGHSDVVRLLLEHGARVVPAGPLIITTPFHTAIDHCGGTKACDILRLLCEANDGHECMELRDTWGMTPLLQAASIVNVGTFEVLLQHGASVHAVTSHGMNLLHIVARSGRHDILRQCIEKFSLEELNGGDFPENPLKMAQESGHREVAQLLKSHIRQVSRSTRSNAGLLGSFRNRFENLKGR